MMRRCMGLLVAACVFSLAAPAQENASEVTRADLATSYLRLEKTLESADLTPEQTAQANREFDQATLKFFQGKFGEAIRQIDQLTLRIQQDFGTISPEHLLQTSIRAEILPRVYHRNSGVTPTVSARTLYPASSAGHVECSARIQLVHEDGRGIQSFALPNQTDENGHLRFETADPDMPYSELPSGRYPLYVLAQSDGLRLLAGEHSMVPSGYWTVVNEPLDTVRENHAARLETIDATTPALRQALAAVKARNALLTDSPSPENTAQFVLNLPEIAAEVDGEIAALERGDDPFAGRTGDYWRVFNTGDRDVPLRVYLPESADTSKPLPLVVAFHGAGGDENMFMDAYGDGRIKELADKHGFLLVTPLTYAFAGDRMGPYFDSLLQALGHTYTLDSDRIFVTGHSMGGGATASLLSVRGEKIAAAAALCGFRGFDANAQTIPPTLVVAAELDPLASPSRVEPAAKAAKAAGHPVEYRLIENYGHTLVVGDILPETLAWMLAKAE